MAGYIGAGSLSRAERDPLVANTRRLLHDAAPRGDSMAFDRREFIAASAAALFAPAAAQAKTTSLLEPAALLAPLSQFATSYMAAMNAPGMTVGLADANGWCDTRQFGVADLSSRRAITPQERFHIGSITKSFAALMVLQLMEEGKIDLARDITSYLPQLNLKTPYGAITVHHLLCHSSGLPTDPPAPGWTELIPTQAFMPGSRFHYCNLGYDWLGTLIETRGGEPWRAALQRRILQPLGMSETFTTIGPAMRHTEVPSYVPLAEDRPYMRQDPLTRAAPNSFTGAAGCIASTASDMNKYALMMLQHGQGPTSRLLSKEAFALLTRRHMTTDEFGPGGGYGYGWMISTVDGKPVIRHTGGMRSFMSSVHIDLETGFAAFASINAQQGYRPVPVTAYAVSLSRAAAAKKRLPAAPDINPEKNLVRAEYVGNFTHADGRNMRVIESSRGLALAFSDRTVELTRLDGDLFACPDPQYRLFAFLFQRAAAKQSDTPGPVVALSWARDTYLKTAAIIPAIAQSDTAVLAPAELAAYEGYYDGGAGFTTSARIVARDGHLWIDGTLPLAHLGNNEFRLADEAVSPETAAFSAEGIYPRVMSLNGTTLTRTGDPFMEML